MNIRAITTGINLSRASNTAKIREVAQFNDRAKKTFVRHGFTVQTLRMTTQPWPQYCSGFSHTKIIERIKSIEYMAREQGVDFVSIGYVRSAPAIKMIPDIIETTDRVSTAVVIADRTGIHYKSMMGAAQAIKKIAKKTQRGYGNFRFAAIAQCPPNIPFYPASYHKGNACFTLALECSDLIIKAFSKA